MGAAMELANLTPEIQTALARLLGEFHLGTIQRSTFERRVRGIFNDHPNLKEALAQVRELSKKLKQGDKDSWLKYLSLFAILEDNILYAKENVVFCLTVEDCLKRTAAMHLKMYEHSPWKGCTVAFFRGHTISESVKMLRDTLPHEYLTNIVWLLAQSRKKSRAKHLAFVVRGDEKNIIRY